ncbi:ATP-binding cassette domain-containing protein [Desulfonatronospira sp.]|uniref:ABC transporter ATP-binding protein n=1 Tax=Desulfonatronospira sp. TaxID=1962951 RepID=UPI0025B86A22|nr:ATP-binding cassette domain-containing protein [Desulfonatronospira sp.]
MAEAQEPLSNHKAQHQGAEPNTVDKTSGKVLLQVRNLKVYFPVHGGLFRRIRGYMRAVDDVSFSVPPGSTVGLVGESGSGKTTIGRSLVRLIQPTAGEIIYSGREIGGLSKRDFFFYRKKMQMIFQDPFNSLNPRMSVEKILTEPLGIHFPRMSADERHMRCYRLMELVGLKPDQLRRYPHEFSGGQRQRIGIARALAVEPEFIICDEPVSALDVSVQATIVNLLQDLQEELGLTYLFIAHDLAVVEHISDYVLVMHQGKIVEQASAEDIYSAPQHPYTRQLLEAIPHL